MDFTLSEQQKQLRDEIIRFGKRVASEGAAARDREQSFDRDLWRKCGEMGLTGLPIPEEFGGMGLDPLSTAILLDAFGYGCKDNGLVFSVCAHLLSCVVPVWKFGTDVQKQNVLRGLCDGTLVGVHAMTEPGSGSDAFALRTVAEPDGDGFRITGAKMFISNGPVADVVIVFALTDKAKGYHGGTTGFLLEKSKHAFHASGKIEKMGLRSSPLGELVFDDLYVGPETVLGGVGGGAMVFTHAMDWERVCLFASHLGALQRLLESGVQYAKTRTQFGQPISKFQAVAHKLVDLKVRLEAARLLTYQSASRLEKTRTVSMDAAMTKLFVSESLVQGALDTMQVFGGYGYMVEYDIERWVRDALSSTLYSGTSEMQRNIIARWMGL